MNAYKSYARWVLIGTCLLVVLASAFNVLVDPYAVFGAPRLSGFNKTKPFAGGRAYVGKLHQVLRVAPKGLIVGNSRPEMGLSPEHPCWPAAARPVYNIALPGLSVYMQVRYAQHSQAAGSARVLVIGVDFVDFLLRGRPPADPSRWPPANAQVEAEGFAVGPDGRPADGFRQARFANYAYAAVSLDTLGHSLATIARQSGEFPRTRTPAGFNPAEGIFWPIVRSEGPRVLFEQKNREMADRLSGNDLAFLASGQTWSAEFEALRRLVRQSRAAGTETVVFINPYHAEYLVLLDAAGRWPEFESWKRRVAELTHTEGVPLWDFSGFDRFSTESIDALPPRGTSLEWFWEPAHYRRELGDLMLANIWRAHCPQDEAGAPSYGVRIDRATDAGTDLDAHLAAQAEALQTYKEAHPDVVERIRGMFDESSR